MFIPDPGSKLFYLGSWIQGQRDLGFPIRIRIKEFKYFLPILLLSSRKYDPGCSDPDFIPIPDPDPGFKKTQKITNPGSETK
jgi:hypothetical protein